MKCKENILLRNPTKYSACIKGFLTGTWLLKGIGSRKLNKVVKSMICKGAEIHSSGDKPNTFADFFHSNLLAPPSQLVINQALSSDIFNGEFCHVLSTIDQSYV